MKFDDLLILLFIAAIAFVNVVLPWLRRQAQRARREAEAAAPDAVVEQADDMPWAPPLQPGSPPITPVAMPVPAEGPRRIRASATAERTPARPRRPIGRAEARRGIVLATVLGPCRAQEPYDGRTPAGR